MEKTDLLETVAGFDSLNEEKRMEFECVIDRRSGATSAGACASIFNEYMTGYTNVQCFAQLSTGYHAKDGIHWEETIQASQIKPVQQ